MASLQELLTEDGFDEHKKRIRSQKKVKFRGRTGSQESISGATEMGSPEIDAVVSILSGYVGQYMREKKFREAIRARVYSCCLTREENHQDSDDGIFVKLELGIENVEKLVENHHGSTKKELKMRSVEYSISLFTIVVASLNSSKSSHLSACAQLYLSILYKIVKNGRMSARHLLHVFSDAPFLARTHLLPQLWDHLFLPHHLHLKIWYCEELEFLSNANYIDKEMKMKALEEAYNAQMDIGTTKFAVYYNDWLKVGAQPPSLPSVPLRAPSRRYSDSFSSQSSNQFLHRAVFGTTPERFSPDLNHRDWKLEGKYICINKDSTNHSSNERRAMRNRRSSSLNGKNQKSDNFRLLNCRSDTTECSVHVVPNATVEDEDRYIWKNDLHRALNIICTSDSLSECEMAIRVMTKVWLDSHGNPLVETELSNSEVIQAILEVLSVSNDDEILELSISLLVQIVTKNELGGGNILLNFDQQLDIFLKLLRNNSLFLKAAALLYLMKPEAKQMIAMEWIPLVLRVLEFGDQLQTFFTIQISPQTAAYYFLDQLLMHFDEDKNTENARHVVSLGGLNLLLRRLEIGDISEKNKAVSIICCCVQAEGSCRQYLAKNINKESLIILLFPRNQTVSQGAFALLTEIFCLHRHQQRIEFLNELKCGWSNLNTMHVMLVYLQRAQPEERPVVAAILLQLDLLGDICECSVYREEIMEEIERGMNCQVLNEKVQEQSAKALLILGGQFSYTGEAVTEKWLLKEAGGLNENLWDSFGGNKALSRNYAHMIREEDDMETWWRRKTAMVLLKEGKNRFLVALSDSIENGIPCLARASLVTVSWISSIIQSMGERNLQSLACSILLPQLLEALDYARTMEEKTLASFSLLNLLKGSEYLCKLSSSHNELINRLQKLSQVTWTAKELISIIKSSLNN